MTQALLCCGISGGGTGCEFDQVWSLDSLTELRLSKVNIKSQNICCVDIPDLDISIRERIELGLRNEAVRGGGTAWAEVAFQHVHLRFVRYYQYRVRIETLIDRNGIDQLTLSAVVDGDLVHACVAACEKKGVKLVLLNGTSGPYSSLLPFSAAYDLPRKISTLESWMADLLAFGYRCLRTHTFYQPYKNLAEKYRYARIFTWGRSLCFSGFNFFKIKKKCCQSGLNLHAQIGNRHQIGFDPLAWLGFDKYDLTVLESGFNYFASVYDVEHLDRIYSGCRRFFRKSMAQRLVLNSDNTCTARLISKAAKAEGMVVDLLPHGLVWEDLTLNAKTNCGVDRVLAWNSTSAAAFERRGSAAIVITHPANAGTVNRKRSLPSDLSKLRVMIMASEWVHLSFGSRPDCFERDILDVLTGLQKLGIRAAHIKCHNSNEAVLAAKMKMLDAIRPFAALDFTILDHHLTSEHLYDRFDLLVIGPTTGLLEASRSATPFVGFRALMHKGGVFSGFDLPRANSVDELVNCIKKYDVNSVYEQSLRINQTLQSGSSPIDLVCG